MPAIRCQRKSGSASAAQAHRRLKLRTIRVELGRLPGHDNSIERRERAAQLLRRGAKVSPSLV